ncbi:MAG TPA: SpoIID/LytB domain-containing protein [Pyrinomonadaceae bacterium]|nr:SpoIID/LytB domain-containing protein [Pyrinomonadaceae bacterium]
MLSSLAQRVITVLLTYSLLCSVAFSQQSSKEESRPRRVQAEWPQAPTATPSIPTPVITSIVGPEPKIRVALSTDTRSAVISSTGRLMNASGSGNTLLALDTSRVRISPHLLSPLPQANPEDSFTVTVVGAASRAEAEETAKEIKKLANEDAQVTFDTETKTWGLIVGSKQPRQEAEELRAQLEDFGLDASVTNPAVSKPAANEPNESVVSPAQPQASVRLAARITAPSRELVASSVTNGHLFSSSAPVSFASDDEKNVPVRYNDRPYRGRIEVFANTRGSLTVVNELGLEDYVRGVVANELSPGGYPAIEALKAQAVAARTYAFKNRGQFMAQGFDLLPTTRSQVYRGLTSENPLSTRAVDETRGLIATYAGEPINALYTSTCGGRTEDSENIFNEAVPYLRGRECAAEGSAAFSSFTIRTNREPTELQSESNVPLARDISLLLIQNVNTLPARVSDGWLNSAASVSEVRNWLANAARVAHQVLPVIADDVNRPGGFATALLTAVVGESRNSTLLNNADADYLLAVRDVQEVPVSNRADLAMLVRDGFLPVYPDATIRPREPLSRAKVIHAIARLLESRNLLQLQKGNAKPTSDNQLVLRTTRSKDQPIRLNPEVFLFRQIGDTPYNVKSVALVGGEAVTFHLGADGLVDYLEVKAAPNGAAADRFSPFSNWTRGLSVGQVQARLSRYTRGIGQLIDLRVASRGTSHRVTDLEVVGTNGTAHVRGGRIRSALGLKEQLFVIDRELDDNSKVTEFVFTGRGWGHGVGMCQVGAYGLAKQGWSYEQILKAYYTGIEVTRMY